MHAYMIIQQAFKAIVNAEHSIAIGEGKAHESSHGRIHSTRWRSDIQHAEVVRFLEATVTTEESGQRTDAPFYQFTYTCYDVYEHASHATHRFG